MPAYVSLADFARGFTENDTPRPRWLPQGAAAPLALDTPAMRGRLEDVLDTVVALQKADWLEDGVFVGPRVMPEVYGHVLHCARALQVSVPPTIVAGTSMSSQGMYGTDSRAYLYLSTFFVGPATDPEVRFLVGRSLGLCAAHLVSANTTYALLVDHGGLRQIARRALGPLLEVVLAPLSVGVRLATSRWHRFAEVACDRAGLLACQDLDAAGRALLRMALAGSRGIDPQDWLAQLDAVRSDASPARFTQLLADRPWTHKRLRALQLFARSECYAEAGGPVPDERLLTDDALEAQTRDLMGVR